MTTATQNRVHPGQNQKRHRMFRKDMAKALSTVLRFGAEGEAISKQRFIYEVECVKHYWGDKIAAAYKLSDGGLKLWEKSQ